MLAWDGYVIVGAERFDAILMEARENTQVAGPDLAVLDQPSQLRTTV